MKPRSIMAIAALMSAAPLVTPPVFHGGQAAHAADPFTVDLTVIAPGTANATAGFSSLTNAIDELKTQNLSNLTSVYTSTSAATATINLRGLNAIAAFPLGSPALQFSVPSIGLNTTFAGATRDESAKLLQDFLLKNQSGLVTEILQKLAATSPIDPMVGNPNSLQNQMARSDFSIGTGIGLTATDTPGRPAPGSAVARQPNLFSVGGEFGIVNSGRFTSNTVTLPLRYIIPFEDPGYALTLDMPLTYIDTQGAKAGYGSFGVALRIPVAENWYLTPGFRAGIGGSLDLGAASIQYSGSIASRYDIYWNDLKVTIGNAIALTKVGGLSVGGVGVNYDMFNQLFNNGVQLEGSLPYTVYGHPTSWQAYVVDTYVAGNAVYVPHYDEIGFTVGTRQGPNTQDWQALRVGAGFVFGEHFNAYKVALTYRF
jgi:hypothetical protein